MVVDLLDLARLESGQASLRTDAVDLSALLDGVIDRLALRAAERSVTLTHESQPLPTLTADGDRLVQVMTNLLVNALEHSPDGGRVIVESRAVADGVSVVVRDEGPGLPPGEEARVFERFYRADTSRKWAEDGGAGLGLAISREIVAAHGGRISAKNRPEGGAAFTVWLPVSLQARTSTAKSSADPSRS
jgi:signal transduction histidine kinase